MSAQGGAAARVAEAGHAEAVFDTDFVQLYARFRREQEALMATARAIFSTLGGLATPGPPEPGRRGSLPELLLAYERSLILWALARTGDEQRSAARLLGIRPSTLNEKMKRTGIGRPCAGG
ncbi:MAG TPA: helix-turn-helix domain-containing protein [Vicinamibacteria bacterium]|nr:helix-turn-helix domain-containing protein [Vicinamibacteria bacterium]